MEKFVLQVNSKNTRILSSLLAGTSIFTQGVFVNTFIIMEVRIKNKTVHIAKYAKKSSNIYKNIEMNISNNSIRSGSHIVFVHMLFFASL